MKEEETVYSTEEEEVVCSTPDLTLVVILELAGAHWREVRSMGRGQKLFVYTNTNSLNPDPRVLRDSEIPCTCELQTMNVLDVIQLYDAKRLQVEPQAFQAEIRRVKSVIARS